MTEEPAETPAAENLDGREDAKASAVLEVISHQPVAGLDVLEIGAGDLDSCRLFKAHGARRVYASDTSPDWSLTYGEKAVDDVISTLRLDARALSTRFAPESLDLVYGIAVIEHISDVEVWFEQMFNVLKPGGVAAVSGGPIWTAPTGHHVWADVDGVYYRFSGPNPIPDWFHLIHDEESLARFLIDEKQIPTMHAIAISDCVYRNPHINRCSYRRLRETIEKSGFDVVKIEENKTWVPLYLLPQIESGKWGDQGPFDVIGANFILRKPK